MTIDNAITIFHGLECNPLFSEKHFKAFEMAIASLEAWGKVKAEIDEQYDRVHPYNISCAEGLEMALEIIDKHLQEISETETWSGFHGQQIIAPKGTFDKIYNAPDEEDDDI